MRKFKRLLAAALTAALAVSLAVLPSGAYQSSFSDVQDSDTAVNADILRLMGVAGGVGGNYFNPGADLSRAEFCTMVVKFMQKGDEVPLHTTRAIFSDVTARHWALGYVNLAASLTVADGEKKVALISGVGDGRFEPDAKISLAQAATILIRLLGYSSEQAGAVWPQSYMNLAGSIGLLDGLSAGTYDNITRGQAARLFVNALNCKTGQGGEYYKTLGSATDDVIVLAVNVDTDDGSARGAIRTSKGTFLPKTEDVEPAALQGLRGALVVNDKQEIVTFVPDDSVSSTIVLSGNAQPAYLQGSGGRQYTISGDAMVYTADDTAGKVYSSAHTSLRSGQQVTLFSEKGHVVAIYAAGSMTTSDVGAVVITSGASAAVLQRLTGGAADPKAQKSFQSISLGQIRPYDVVTYDELTNTLLVSDLRLTCVIEEAAPNSRAPKTVKALGHTFEVLDSAWDTVPSLGKENTLLLTVDGKVAGFADPASVRSTAVGTVSGGGVEVFLPNGGTLSLSGTVANADEVGDRLVLISSGARGVINASRLPARTSSSPFDAEEMRLGSRVVAAGVRIYEQVNNGAMVEIDRSDLLSSSIPADQIASYHLNSSDMVDYLILNDITGNAYQYGMMVYTRGTVTETDGGGEQDKDSAGTDKDDSATKDDTDDQTPGTGGSTQTASKWYWTLVNSHPTRIEKYAKYFDGSSGSFVGAVIGKSGKYYSHLKLTAIEKVRPSDFFENLGVSYVTVGGKTYRVADEVECYQRLAEDRDDPLNWYQQSSGKERLDACKASSSNMTVYIDPIGQQVRVIEAK